MMKSHLIGKGIMSKTHKNNKQDFPVLDSEKKKLEKKLTRKDSRRVERFYEQDVDEMQLRSFQ